MSLKSICGTTRFPALYISTFQKTKVAVEEVCNTENCVMSCMRAQFDRCRANEDEDELFLLLVVFVVVFLFQVS